MLGPSWGSVLAACRVGAEWAWRQVYEDLAPALLRYHRARGSADPDDLVGDTLVRVVRGLPAFEGNEEQFRAWVFAISRRRAIDIGRSVRRHPVHPVPSEDLIAQAPIGDAEDDAMRSLDEERVRVVLDGLTPDQRDVLVLRLVTDLTIDQVATVMGRSPGAVKALQARGLEHVRRQIYRGAVTFSAPACVSTNEMSSHLDPDERFALDLRTAFPPAAMPKELAEEHVVAMMAEAQLLAEQGATPAPASRPQVASERLQVRRRRSMRGRMLRRVIAVAAGLALSLGGVAMAAALTGDETGDDDQATLVSTDDPAGDVEESEDVDEAEAADSDDADADEQGEDADDQGEDADDLGEDGDDQGEDGEDQGEDGDDQGEDGDDQGEDGDDQGDDADDQVEDADDQGDQGQDSDDDSDDDSDSDSDSDEGDGGNGDDQ
ncbi:MAG TPA: sigma-70 family RNA polymerase sigma factor [Actinomycetota bacterium]|nr:sigma-70 family RNA polymerase sigma factor [Actinomycetota bacterium]